MIAERRVFERFPVRFPVKFKDSRDEYGTEVFLRDASALGAHIITRERLFLDDPVTLEVEVRRGEPPTVLRGKVAWTRPANALMWDVGLRFHKVDFMNMSRLFESALQS